ncbi:hypothetical protein MTO96_048873 [Rhipicephalus appendiculatus]
MRDSSNEALRSVQRRLHHPAFRVSARPPDKISLSGRQTKIHQSLAWRLASQQKKQKQLRNDITSGTGHRLNTMKDFNGKVALVTGGAMGLGRGIVESLMQKGCKVSILDIDEPMGKQTAADMVKKFPNSNCVFYKCDVSNENQFEDGFKKTKNHFVFLRISSAPFQQYKLRNLD